MSQPIFSELFKKPDHKHFNYIVFDDDTIRLFDYSDDFSSIALLDHHLKPVFKGIIDYEMDSIDNQTHINYTNHRPYRFQFSSNPPIVS